MQDCPGAMKHLCQIASILGNLERLCLLSRRCTFVEFGAGRGAVSYWLSKVASESKKDSEVFLIDRASQRHKLDNRLKDGDEALGSVPVSRIKADIEHLVLDSLLDVPRLDTGSEDETRIVAVTKHLCGAATDFALRCLANSKIKDKSVCFATCCHHRCEWKSYVGKSVLQSYGFNASNFRVLCSLTSWLTCGSRKREEKLDPCSDEISQQRYAKLGFTVNESEEIGRICKDIIDAGRINYLKSVGFADANCCIYVPESVTPENVLLIAKTVESLKGLSIFHLGCQPGCVGTVSALANIIPEVVCKTFSLAKCGSWDDASALNRRLIQPNMAVTSQFGVAGLKAVMDAYGYYGGSVRRPLLSIDESGAKAAMKPFLENGF
ncbi:unnamed protein product [Notodromas monacha]|uniref:tRNA:m(4)X modification enzyme TRM13 n=1 Tax=Notodromas monacha TaxID=399045 RepID=A0A7R9C156_9CRUS|nr:unnamed protein product [Notodromas monacha]CAG0924984.1 unnamed protein product [Notodromas monacha]